jgi:hypothetical protein
VKGATPYGMLAVVAASNFGWWTNFKLLALAFDRGGGAVQVECSSPIALQAPGFKLLRIKKYSPCFKKIAFKKEFNLYHYNEGSSRGGRSSRWRCSSPLGLCP